MILQLFLSSIASQMAQIMKGHQLINEAHSVRPSIRVAALEKLNRLVISLSNRATMSGTSSET